MRYASAMSQVVASEFGGRQEISRYTIEKVSHDIKKSSALMKELIDALGNCGKGESGYENFCTSLNLPGQLGLGTIEMGED